MAQLLELTQIPKGTVMLPASKSIAHRAAICAGLANGNSVIKNVGTSEDVIATIRCLTALGKNCTLDGTTLFVKQSQERPKHEAVLDCGESGSTLRFLLPIALTYNSPLQLTGHGRLMQRPLDAFSTALQQNGARISQVDNTLLVKGPLHAGTYRFSGAISSQYVTGLLFALPLLKGDSIIELTTPLESRAYVDLTLETLQSFGIWVVQKDYRRFEIIGQQQYLPNDFTVEADYSAAAFFLASGALGCDVACAGLNPHSLQGDREFIGILERCGISLKTDTIHEIPSIQAIGGGIKPIEVDVKDIPDLVPPLTSLLCFAEGTSKIINAARLRMKESDRLHALAVEFNKLGANIEEREDALIIHGVKRLKGGVVDAHNDHRIAMALATASIRSDKEISLSGWESVKKSYPKFWKDFFKTERSISK